MKKILSILAIGMFVIAFTPEISNAQSSPVYFHLMTGTTAYTYSASVTAYTTPVSVLNSKLMEVSIYVATDSVSGTPDTKYVLQRSGDATRWYSVAGDTLSPTYNGLKSVNANQKNLDVNPFNAPWV